jgi:hypothetical protein
VATLNEPHTQLDALARTLLARETLDEDEADLAGISRDHAAAARERGKVPGTPPTPGMAPDGVSVVHSDTKNP